MKVLKKTKKIITIIVLLVLLTVFACSVFAYKTKNAAHDNESHPYLYNGRKNIECLYYNEKDFINVPGYETMKEINTIRGCIVPHHLVAEDLIHEVFQNVSQYKEKYKTVVLIGPDHESQDKGKIFTALSNWQTPTGILNTDTEATKELLNNDFVVESAIKLSKEHSTSSIIPFIKFYLGDVNVITLVLTKQVKLDDVDTLVNVLYEKLNIEETLFIASVDFSHYLDLEQASKMDLISMDAIENNNIDKIMSFTNDNLDSPISIATMLKIMDKAGVTGQNVLNHSNLELILKKKTDETTSYITYLFY